MLGHINPNCVSFRYYIDKYQYHAHLYQPAVKQFAVLTDIARIRPFKSKARYFTNYIPQPY